MSRTRFILTGNKVVAEQMITMRKSEVDKLVAEVNALRAQLIELEQEHTVLRAFAEECAYDQLDRISGGLKEYARAVLAGDNSE
jgi:cell division protein FtsB